MPNLSVYLSDQTYTRIVRMAEAGGKTASLVLKDIADRVTGLDARGRTDRQRFGLPEP